MKSAISTEVILIIVSIIAIFLFALAFIQDQIKFLIYFIFSETAWDLGNRISTLLFILSNSELQNIQAEVSVEETFEIKANNSLLTVKRVDCKTPLKNICKASFFIPAGIAIPEMQGSDFILKKTNNTIKVIAS